MDLEDKVAVLAELNAVFEPFFLVNMRSATAYKFNGYSISYDPGSKNVSVDVDVDYKTAVVSIAGWDRWEANVQTATSLQLKAGGAFSMKLVLDRSGSMG